MAIIGLLRRANQRRSGMRHQPMVLLALVLASFGVIAARLIWLQLIEGSRYRELADENRIRLVPRPPIRGRLLDRDGEVLASSRLAHNLYVLPRLVNHRQWPPL
ncbi:MAG: penicillin-binding protein 2, partial [Prochlorococcus sp.]|nr:penicillin-binding protein 2 [Prochlorococcus sp.]